MEERIIKDINKLLAQLFQKMKEAGYEWDAEKKELSRIEHKGTESDDERIRKELIDFVGINTLSIDERHDRWLAWLEKQKPIAWSEEDEEWFNFTMDYLDNGQQEWLKSLKERME